MALNRHIGKMMQTEVAWVERWLRPYFFNIGTISIPPPAPNRPLISPANTAKIGYNFLTKLLFKGIPPPLSLVLSTFLRLLSDEKQIKINQKS